MLAAANYYLAVRTAAGLPFLDTASEAMRLHERGLSVLRQAATIHGPLHRLPEVEARWRAEFADHTLGPGAPEASSVDPSEYD